jgi:hypothetical protein
MNENADEIKYSENQKLKIYTQQWIEMNKLQDSIKKYNIVPVRHFPCLQILRLNFILAISP